MRKLLERTIESIGDRLVLLAPPGKLSPHFHRIVRDPAEHARRCRDVQLLRGGVYLRDGALRPQDLTSDGLHRTPEDEQSWHVLMVDGQGRLEACIWYLEHDNSVSLDDLRARTCPLALRAGTRDQFREAVETEIALARKEGIRYAESGGWAVSEESRLGTDGLVLALSAFSLGNISGGVRALSTATSRHCSTRILQRLGGSPLAHNGEAIPSYFDPKHRCDMDVLRFDSRRPDPKYLGLVRLLEKQLANVPVVVRAAAAPAHAVPMNQQRLAARPVAAA